MQLRFCLQKIETAFSYLTSNASHGIARNSVASAYIFKKCVGTENLMISEETKDGMEFVVCV